MASVTLPAVVLLAPFLFSTLQTPGSGKQHKDGMLHGRAANAHTARVKLVLQLGPCRAGPARARRASGLS
jgi:hypothetical protein